MTQAPLPPRPKIQRRLDVFGHFFVVVGALGILALLALTVVGVIWRYALNDPIFGLQDLSALTSSVVVASAVAYGAVSNSHITVNVMPAHFGRRVRRVTDVIVRAAGAAMLATAAYALIKKGSCGLACGNITSNLNILHGPFYYVLAGSLAFFAVYLTVQLIIGVMHWRGEDPNEAIV